ncbi:MAG: VWA domain-containing protein [candidate division Zixibacteria bacterium]|nr:VWA domain-containing protein [candidate division Zixibacteria bacterium]
MIFRLIVGMSLLLFLLFSACDNSVVSRTDVGWVLDELYFNSELPSNVNIMFQVIDNQNNFNGKPDLLIDDFMVYENGEEYSVSESFPVIRKMESIQYKLKTVLLLDNSASVASNINEIKSAAIALVENITVNQEFAIYKFSDSALLVHGFTSDVSSLSDSINAIEVGSATTNLYGATITGLENWGDYTYRDSIQHQIMILFTDGRETQHSKSLQDALTARGDKNLITVGLGNEIDENALKTLATRGYYHIDSISNIVEVFTEIQGNIVDWANSFYWLNYMSPSRGNANCTIRLEIVGNENKSATRYIENVFSSVDFFSVNSGLYINTSGELPYGISDTEIKIDSTVRLKATTYRPANPPSYIWHSTDETVVDIEENSYDNSFIYIEGVGLISDTASVIIKDTANDLYDTVHVEIISN